MIMADRNIINNNRRSITFHGEPLSTNHNRQDPEPTIMESTEARNLSGNQTNNAGTNEDDERIIGPMVGLEESPQKRARTSSKENLGVQQTGPVTYHGPSQGTLLQNALPGDDTASQIGRTMPVIQEENGGESKQADTAMSDANVGDLDISDIDFSDFESADEGADVHPVDAPSESQRTETFKQKWETPGPLETELHPMADLPSRRQAIVNSTLGTDRTTALTRHRGLLDTFIIVSADWGTQLTEHIGRVGAEIAVKVGKLTDCSNAVQKPSHGWRNIEESLSPPRRTGDRLRNSPREPPSGKSNVIGWQLN